MIRAISPLTTFFSAGVFALTAVSTASASDEKYTTGPQQIKYEFNDLSISQGRLALSLSRGKGTDIYLVDFKKLEIVPVVTGPGVDEYPSFSPDGQKIAYSTDQDGDRELYIVNSDGTNPVRLTNSKGSDEDPNWSADGKRIVFSSSRGKKGVNVFTIQPDGTGIEQLTDTPNNNTVPKWSTRGDEILYSTNAYWPGWDIMLLDYKSKQQKVMTHGYQSFCRASFSPDASQFVFSYGSAQDIDLYLQKKGESRPTELTSMGGREYDGIFIDDTRVLFVADGGDESGVFQLWLANVSSKKVTRVITIDGSVRYLSYTPFASVEAIAEDIQRGDTGSPPAPQPDKPAVAKSADNTKPTK